MSITKCPGHMRSLKLKFSSTVLTLGLKGGSLILRRSRSFAAFVTHALPSPSDGLRSKPCS